MSYGAGFRGFDVDRRVVAEAGRSFLLWGTVTTQRRVGEICRCVAVSGGKLFDGDKEEPVVVSRLNIVSSIAELLFVWEVIKK